MTQSKRTKEIEDNLITLKAKIALTGNSGASARQIEMLLEKMHEMSKLLDMLVVHK